MADRKSANPTGGTRGAGGASPPLRITQVRSINGTSRRQRDTLRTLGLGRVGASSERADEPTVRGQLAKVAHLVRVGDG